MAQCNSDENLSDDEIFFGKLTLKEVKKHLLSDNHRHTITCGTETKRVSNDDNVSIIETHSEPDLSSVKDTVACLDYSNASFASRASMGWDIKPADDSFLKIEEMVTQMCVSPKNNKKEELNNTSEVVEFILNNANSHDNKNNKSIPIVNEKETEEILLKVIDCTKSSSEVENENVQTANTVNVNTEVIPSAKSFIEVENENTQTANMENVNTKVIHSAKSFTEVENEITQTANMENVNTKVIHSAKSLTEVENENTQTANMENVNTKVIHSAKSFTEVENENTQTANMENVNTKAIHSAKSYTEVENENVQTANMENVTANFIHSAKSFTEVENKNVQTANTGNVDTKYQIKIETSYEGPSKTPSKVKKQIPNIKIEAISTPSAEVKPTKDGFKTPKNPILLKGNQKLSTKKTPSRINPFQHITSPVASYIKNGPQVPLLKEVHPKKPLPGTSSIPKFIKNTSDDKGKENIMLPSIAYRSAKKTKMLTIPDKEKLPQSPWAKKIASSLPKPVVIKHDHREVNSIKKPLFTDHEDSFANLSLHQADVSVCTQKSAVTK